MTSDLLYRDRSIRENLAQLGIPALRELKMVLEVPKPCRDAVARALIETGVRGSGEAARDVRNGPVREDAGAAGAQGHRRVITA